MSVRLVSLIAKYLFAVFARELKRVEFSHSLYSEPLILFTYLRISAIGAVVVFELSFLLLNPLFQTGFFAYKLVALSTLCGILGYAETDRAEKLIVNLFTSLALLRYKIIRVKLVD